MNEPICRCPTCKEPIDICPYCKDYKPVSNKFCQECFDLYSEEKSELHKKFCEAEKDLNDKYNLIIPANPLEILKEKLQQLESDDSTDDT
ncbi:MAG: hypothetical protein Q8898_15630 [Bacillota bacterium]|nr:hypothetical protein [Bacillota bacterium]